MAQSDVSSRFEPQPGQNVPNPCEVRDAEPEESRTRKILKALFVYACLTLVFVLYEIATAPTCSSSSVENLVMDIVEAKLLHARKFSVALSDVKVLERNAFTDTRCSAEVDIDGKALPRRVDYRWTTNKGYLGTVYAKMRP
jgi:hypothetical protein